jgi:hypothetical protein
MELPPAIAAELQRRIDYARIHRPGALSRDGKALRVDGSIGYDCWISPEGDVYLETYDMFTEDSPVADRSRRAQLLVLSLGIRTFPDLESLLPSRPPEATDCADCKGKGKFHAGGHQFVCNPCCGLGWTDPEL